MKQINKIEGITEIAVFAEHLCFVDKQKNLLLNYEVIQKGYGSIGTFEDGYLKYGLPGKDQVVLYDLKSQKKIILPEGIGIDLKGEYSPEFHAYSYEYFPNENKSAFQHFLFNVEEKKITKKLFIAEDFAFLGTYKQYSLFVNYNGRSLSSLRLYSGKDYAYLWQHSFSNVELQGSDVYVYYYLGVCADAIIFSTNNGWLVGLDINTGEELWMLKVIDELEIPDIIKKQGVLGASKFKLNAEKDFLYVYAYNVYVEIEARTGKVQKIINQYPKAPPAVSRNPLQQDFWHFFSVYKDILYYPVSYEEAVPDEYRREVVVKIVGISIYDGAIKDVYEFNSEESKQIGRFRDFQLSNGKLFCLSMSNTLYVIEC